MRTVLTLALLLATSPLAAQSGNPVDNLTLADAKSKDPSLVAAAHLTRAERALARALRSEEQEVDAEKRAKKARSAYQQAEREATSALASDPGLLRAYLVRGQARLSLGNAAAAREDCLLAVSHAPGDGEALFCYGRASLGVGEGGQALTAYTELRGKAGSAEQAAQLLAEIRTWVDANPQGEKEQAAARWLEQNLPQGALP